MVRIAPIRLSFNPKTLWFDAGQMELGEGDAVVVSTARGEEFGHVAQAVFEKPYEETKKLKSPLKPVLRLADEEDAQRADEVARLSTEALPVFRRLAHETVPDMNPVAVEYLFGAEKAVFYFDAEERVDFRELVRKLSSELHVRVDMKQIGVRDGARMVGGLGHCGQELCCARLGGDFNPVSIRMAKEQDLSLNPQKISGLCGRLMCCLRYEFDAYKDFHSRAPKKNARIDTPDGEGKVVDLDVPREVVSIKVGDEKPVKVPLADMEPPEEGKRPNAVGEAAWEEASAPATIAGADALGLFTTQLSREDKLAEPGKVTRNEGAAKKKSSRGRRARRGSSEGARGQAEQPSKQSSQRKSRRRRSTTVKSDGSASTQRGQVGGGKRNGTSQRGKSPQQKREGGQRKSVQVGRNSSALRAGRGEGAPSQDARQSQAGKQQGSGQRKRRRRSHKTGDGGKQQD